MWVDLKEDVSEMFASLVTFDKRDTSLSVVRLGEDNSPERRAYKTQQQRIYDRNRLSPVKQTKKELRELATKLVASGLSMRAVAKQINVDRTTISRWMKAS